MMTILEWFWPFPWWYVIDYQCIGQNEGILMTYFYVWVIIGKALDIELEDLGLMEKSAYATC